LIGNAWLDGEPEVRPRLGADGEAQIPHYGESFRAPTFTQIYGNSSALYVDGRTNNFGTTIDHLDSHDNNIVSPLQTVDDRTTVDLKGECQSWRRPVC
jgi:hypothetical protein